MEKDVLVGKQIITVLLCIEIIRFILKSIIDPVQGVVASVLPLLLMIILLVLIYKGFQTARHIFVILHIGSGLLGFPKIINILSENKLDWLLTYALINQLLILLVGIVMLAKPVGIYMRNIKNNKKSKNVSTPSQSSL